MASVRVIQQIRYPDGNIVPMIGMTSSDGYAARIEDVHHWGPYDPNTIDSINIAEFDQKRRDWHPNFGPRIQDVPDDEIAELHKQWSVKNALDYD